jgi:nitroimidazol reductase NimA-like FMN-containing flavoprotein (pyridoxamine 5'-phosphate oxidase superfamily)
MSNAPRVRRADLEMDEAGVRGLLERGFCGRLATVGADGWPYALPLLYVLMDQQIYMHNAQAPGHLRRNLDYDPRACLAIDEPGEVFGYGRYLCDTTISYASVLVFGTVRVVGDAAEKRRFCTALMDKYGVAIEGRPRDFFPRLEHIAVYAMRMERMSGKHISLPGSAARWPLQDRTKSPGASPPGDLA